MTDLTPTPPELDLPALTMIAKGATQADWMILPSQQTRGAHSIPGVARTICATSANARHIAAFDPPTVLALIARAEAAEKAVAAVRELHKPVPVYTTEMGDCEHGDDCEGVEISDGAYCPVHTDGLTCDSCAAIGEDLSAGELPAYPCPTIAALDTHTPETETP